MFEKFQVQKIEVMTGIYSEAEALTNAGRFDVRGYGFVRIDVITHGVGFCVELHAIRVGRSSPLDHFSDGIHKKGYPDVEIPDFTNYPLEKVCVFHSIPSCVGGQHVGWIRDQRCLCWPYFPEQFHKPIVGISFDVEFRSDDLLQLNDIYAPDMPLVRARVNRDPLSAEPFTIHRRLDNVGIIAPTCVSKGCNLVDIDTQPRHLLFFNLKGPQLTIPLKRNYTNMSLKTTIDADIKKAMLARSKEELDVLRSIKSMILLAETEKGVSAEISPEVEGKLLMKAAKQRKESAEIFQKEGREDLAQKENFQLDVISRYLPKQLTEAEILSVVQGIVTKVGAQGPQDMGKVMGVATKELAGKADGKMIADIVKKLLMH